MQYYGWGLCSIMGRVYVVLWEGLCSIMGWVYVVLWAGSM